MVILGMMVLGLPMFASAATFLADGNPVSADTVNDNLYVTGGNPIVSGDVMGDLLIAGGNVSVSGNILGDLAAAGGSVSITGRVDGDVRVFGGTIYLDSTVKGEVISFGGQVVLGPQAKINKDLIAGGDEVKIHPNSIVLGKKNIMQEIKDVSVKVQEASSGIMSVAFWIGILYLILAYLIVGAVFMGVFPKVVKKCINGTLKDGNAFWRALGMGLVLLIIIPVVSFLLLITGIGAMLGGILMLMYAVYAMVSIVFAGMILGTLLKKLVKKGKPDVDWAWGLGGIVLFPLLSVIPFVGWIIGFVFFVWALGATISSDYGTFKSVK